MLFQIKSRYDYRILFELDCDLQRACVETAAKEKADLRGADLRGADLYRADLHRADLSGANLGGANLYRADLRGADLYGANLYRADLRGADLSGADLSGANLRGADLRGADLCGADLYGADLRGANLRGADLRAGLTRVTWQSHALLSEILNRAAGESVPRRMIAGLVAVSLDWCWSDFVKIDHPEKEWAVTELAKWVTEDAEPPSVIKPAAMAIKECEPPKPTTDEPVAATQ